MLYKKIIIPEFELMRSEILAFVQPQIAENLRYWDIPKDVVEINMPRLFNFLLENFQSVPVLFRFYNTPPFGFLGPHIDNLKTARNKMGFNIPLLNTANTQMNYYTTDEDNLRITDAGFAKMPAQAIIDKSKLVKIDTLELLEPAVIRTDIIHDVINNNETYRLVLGMKLIGTEFEHVLRHI